MFGRKKETENDINEISEILEEPILNETPKKETVAAKTAAPGKTIIGKDAVVIGNFDAKEAIELYGIIRGNVRTAGNLFVASNGSLIGEAAVDSLSVDGKIEGTVLCSSEASFSSSSKMKGNLSTTTLSTQNGSVFEGKLNMISKRPVQPEEQERP